MVGSMIFCQMNILEHSLSFHGDNKEMHTNSRGQSDIVTHTTNILNEIIVSSQMRYSV